MSKLRGRLQIFGFLLGVLLLILQFRNGILFLQQKNIQNIYAAGLALAALAEVLAILLQMLAWSSAMKSLGEFLSITNVFRGYLLSFLPRYIPGTIWGYISRSEWLYRDHSVSYRTSYQGSMLETASTVLANMMVIWLFTFSFRDGTWLIKLLLVILLPVLVWAVLQRLSRLQGDSKFVQLIRKMSPDVSLRYWLQSILFFTLHWLANGASMLFVARTLGLQDSLTMTSSFLNYAGTYALAWLFGFIIFFVPAGIGFREMALTFLLASRLGMSSAQAGILAIAFRVLSLACELLCLATSLVSRKISLPLHLWSKKAS